MSNELHRQSRMIYVGTSIAPGPQPILTGQENEVPPQRPVGFITVKKEDTEPQVWEGDNG